MKRALFTAVALLTLGGGLAAQNQQSASAQASITVLSPISFSKSSDLAFGTVLSSAGVISAATATQARWDGLGTPGHNVSVTFSLPTVLTRIGNTSTIPIQFGNMSATFLAQGGTPVQFDPAGGLFGFTLINTGGFSVTMGGASVTSAASDIQVNVGGAPAGTFVGQIVCTVVES